MGHAIGLCVDCRGFGNWARVDVDGRRRPICQKEELKKNGPAKGPSEWYLVEVGSIELDLPFIGETRTSSMAAYALTTTVTT
jgi:hypothetical protein